MPRVTRRHLVTALAVVVAWAAVAVPVAALVFVNSSRTTQVASHQALVQPTLDGWAQVDLGPFLPSFRYPLPGQVGAHITLGKTNLTSYDALADRYALIASQPEGQIAHVKGKVREMAIGAVLAGTAAGLVAPGLWFLLGPRRRRELTADLRTQAFTATAAVTTVVVIGLLAVHPWDPGGDVLETTDWQPLGDAVPDLVVPEQARALQIDRGLLTRGTERLVASALDSFQKSSDFYRAAAESAAELPLHQPEEGQTVAVMVSDRHDNIGMDRVARAVADVGGATWMVNAGDDTSTGSSWEAFSLESLAEAFADYDDIFAVAGNHDHGGFIQDQARELGFTVLDGEVVEGPDGIRLLGVSDPRSSGLGNWRDETGLSFSEVTDRLADAACAADQAGDRVSTLLVHDANNGAEALRRGCVDLVLGGHLHVVVGPEAVTGENGRIGHRYTTASTGGAAYAIAIGTKPRRDAVVSLITYEEGRPVGVQWVRLSPLGEWTVGDYTELTYEGPAITAP